MERKQREAKGTGAAKMIDAAPINPTVYQLVIAQALVMQTEQPFAFRGIIPEGFKPCEFVEVVSHQGPQGEAMWMMVTVDPLEIMRRTGANGASAPAVTITMLDAAAYGKK